MQTIRSSASSALLQFEKSFCLGEDINYLTFSPLYVQLPNFMSQSWSSNGNHVISIKHVDLKIPKTIYLKAVAMLMITWRNVGADSMAGDHDVGGVGSIKWFAGAVVHQNVRSPDERGRNPDICNVPVLWLIPAQIIIHPFLHTNVTVQVQIPKSKVQV